MFLALGVRLIGLTSPYTDQFVWRSLDNAAIARNFLTQGMNLFYPQVDWAGPSGLVETELPLQMWLAAGIYRLLGHEAPWVGRGLTVLASLGLLLTFWKLAAALLEQKPATLALFVLAFVPTSVFFSRTFQQDALMLFAQLLALLCAFRWLEEREQGGWYPAGVAFGAALGALIKPTALLIGVPIAYLAWRRYGPRALLQPGLWTVAFLSLLPPILWYLHARHTYELSGFTFGIFSGGHDKFQWRRFLTTPFWYRAMAERFLTWHLTPTGCLLTGLGAWTLLRNPHPFKGFILAWLLPMLAFIPLVAEGNLDMLYYQWMAIPPLALLTGMSWLSLELSPFRRRAVLLLAAGLLPFSLVQLRPAYGEIQKPYLALAEKVLLYVPAGALLLDAGAYDVHNPGGYNFEPHTFYYTGHKGWGLLEEDFTPEKLEAFRQKGATHLVTRRRALLEKHPAFLSQLLQQSRVLYDGPDALIVALEPPRSLEANSP